MRNKPRFRLPSDARECAVLSELWRVGEASVRDLHDCLGAGEGLAYTTTAKVVDRLREKGLVERQRKAGVFLYRPCIDQEVVERARAHNLINRLLGDAPRSAVANLVDAVEAIDPVLLEDMERALAARRRNRDGS